LAVISQCTSSNDCTNGILSVLAGNGDGTFQAAGSFSSGGYQPSSVAVGDLNADGKPDLLIANSCASSSGNCLNGEVSVLFGNGDGSFQAASNYASDGLNAVSVAVADLNGDGRLDLVVVNGCDTAFNCGAGGVTVMLGNGDGTFQGDPSYPSGGFVTQAVAVGDFNGDGKPDLVVANYCVGSGGNCANGVIGILLGKGDGTYEAPAIFSSGGYATQSVLVGDFNGDGKVDIAVANLCLSSSSCSNGGVVSVLLGNGDGTFQQALSYASGGYEAFWLAAGDFNGDGKPDLAVANACVSGNNCSNGRVGVFC